MPMMRVATAEAHPVVAAQAKRRLKAPRYLGGGFVVALILFGVYALMPKDAGISTAERLSVGILPFENTGSPDDDYFVNGMAEDLARRLAGVQVLRVAGPTDPDHGGWRLRAGSQAF